jgi:general secretion pathway protein L
MAHIVTGIDLGASAVKFVLIEVGFRASRMLSAFEEVVPPGDAPFAERQGEALQAGLARLPGESIPYLAIPGETLAVRVLDLPFADPRKIDQVVGYELEGQIVHALQDVVFDHAVLKSPGVEGTAVLAAAARSEDIAELLATLGTLGLEPRSLYPAPIVYHALFSAKRAEAGRPIEAEEPPCRVLVDLGHRRTNVCFVVRGETVYARTITRGGETLTAAVAEAFHLPLAGADQAKREHGFVATAARPAHGASEQRMDAALRSALAPLLRELRQTLASFRARDKTPLEEVLLTGGGADLPGLAEHLEEELAVPVSLYAPEMGSRMDDLPGSDGAQGRFALAAAVAWAGALGGKEIDLRRGPFQYKANLSVLRQKAPHLGALVAAVLICAGINGAMALARLNKEKDQLQAQLKSATTELFGAPRMDSKAVTNLLRKGFRDEMAPIPKATAYELLGEISRRVPSADKIKLDIQEVDIKAKKAFIKGTVDSAVAVDDMVNSLKSVECFGEEINKGTILDQQGAKSFTININSKCP